MVEIVLAAIAFVAALMAAFFAWRLWRWEDELRTARILIHYKTKTKMSPTLYEWLEWSRIASREEARRRNVYRIGGTTIQITAAHSGHGKTTVKTKKP